MNRLDRLSAILIHLQSKKIVTAQELSDRFEISVRTVYRDIRSLEQAGVPIGAEAGIGYFLSEAWHLPPVMFTNDEAIALMIAGKFIKNIPDAVTQRYFESGLYKIKSVLQASQKEKLNQLEQQTVIAQYVSQDALPERNIECLPTIQNALINKQILQISYTAQSAQSCTQRQIEPIGLCFYNRVWHLIAWCCLRKDYRDFRLDRISHCVLLDQSFDRSRHPSIDEYFARWVQSVNLHEVTIALSHGLAQHITSSRYWYGFVSEHTEGDRVLMRFMNHDLHGVARWILSLGPQAEPLSPPELVQLLRQLVDQWHTELVKGER